jgi:hypothetical protein
MATKAVDAFEQAANSGHVDAQCRASGNPVRHCIDGCLETSADYANDMCDIFAAAEGGDEGKANEDILVQMCLEHGWPRWGCAGFRWWIQQRQADVGLYRSCNSWTPASWAQMCDAACNDHFWCTSTCDNTIPFFAEGGIVQDACLGVGRARNEGFDSTCGWQGDFSAPGCGILDTGSHCDADCPDGQGCNIDDCATTAWVVTVGITEGHELAEGGRWNEGAFALSTDENGAKAFNDAAASLSDDLSTMLQATCESVGVLATCAGHDHESLCGMLPNATASTAGR